MLAHGRNKTSIQTMLHFLLCKQKEHTQGPLQCDKVTKWRATLWCLTSMKMAGNPTTPVTNVLSGSNLGIVSG